MKTFAQYLAESTKEYTYRVKTVVPIDDKFLDRLETVLRKYNIVDVSAPKKTIIQNNPLDFKDIGHAEVFIVDVTTRIPASSYIMQQELRGVLNIPEKYIVVRGKNEPIEIETMGIQAAQEIEAEAKEKGLTPAPLLSAEPTYQEVDYDAQKDPAYGDEYNKKFLNYLKNVEYARPDMTAEPATAEKSVAFNWLKGGKEVAAQEPAPGTGIHGNYDDTEKVFRKNYTDGDGKTKSIQRTSDQVRKTK